MEYYKLSAYIYDCNNCPTRCDGISKKKYIFTNDVEFAEQQENIIINKLIEKGFQASKCQKDGYPDIVIKKNQKIVSYLEVKAQRRTFMSVKKILPDADLLPSETIALNLSDLQRYIEIYHKEKVPLSIIWVLQHRPCIVPEDKSLYFYQKIKVLENIYRKYGAKRRFRRKSGKGDVVNGEHKGVVVNYHFSLRELKAWNI